MGARIVQYFVVLPNAQKFGPADLGVLNQWAAEGRILSETILEEVATGRRAVAAAIPGLAVPAVTVAEPNQSPFAPPSAYQPAQTYVGYQRGNPPSTDTGQGDLTLSWIFGSLGLVFCISGGLCSICALVSIGFPIAGIIFANRAAAKGNPGARAARTFSIVGLVIQAIGVVFALGFLGFAMLSGR